MVSKKVADNLVKKTLKMNEKIYNEILQKYESIFKSDEDLEVFLTAPERYTITAGIDGLINEATSNIQTACLNSIRDVRFSQPAQKALYETVIQERVGALMTNENSLQWKNTIADIIRDNSEKSWKDISKEIQAQTDIGKSNADRIARTEEHISRTNAEYIVAHERGANSYYVVCNNPCEECEELYQDGEVIFDMDKDVSELPPLHPNCRCSAIFIKDNSIDDNEEDEIE